MALGCDLTWQAEDAGVFPLVAGVSMIAGPVAEKRGLLRFRARLASRPRVKQFRTWLSHTSNRIQTFSRSWAQSLRGILLFQLFQLLLNSVDFGVPWITIARPEFGRQWL